MKSLSLHYIVHASNRTDVPNLICCIAADVGMPRNHVKKKKEKKNPAFAQQHRCLSFAINPRGFSSAAAHNGQQVAAEPRSAPPPTVTSSLMGASTGSLNSASPLLAVVGDHAGRLEAHRPLRSDINNLVGGGAGGGVQTSPPAPAPSPSFTLLSSDRVDSVTSKSQPYLGIRNKEV